MNHPQHMFERRALLARQSSSSSSSIDSASIVLYPLDRLVPTSFDARRIGKARSSWALYSRVNGMKKRHAPPAAKSFPGTESSSKRTRKSRRTNNSSNTTPKPILTKEVGQSRWESLPPCSLSVQKSTSSLASSSSSSSSTSTSSTTTSNRGSRGSGRPTLPKRQKSLENSSSSEGGKNNNNNNNGDRIRESAAAAEAVVPRKAKLNQAAADKALRSFRLSFQAEARKAIILASHHETSSYGNTGRCA